ncbi:putative ATP-dependent RNA [Sesbania bispinosa]|nr:putative ATP-dependent RNA [Sesbania bispinosa]
MSSLVIHSLTLKFSIRSQLSSRFFLGPIFGMLHRAPPMSHGQIPLHPQTERKQNIKITQKNRDEKLEKSQLSTIHYCEQLTAFPLRHGAVCASITRPRLAAAPPQPLPVASPRNTLRPPLTTTSQNLPIPTATIMAASPSVKAREITPDVGHCAMRSTGRIRHRRAVRRFLPKQSRLHRRGPAAPCAAIAPAVMQGRRNFHLYGSPLSLPLSKP